MFWGTLSLEADWAALTGCTPCNAPSCRDTFHACYYARSKKPNLLDVGIGDTLVYQRSMTFADLSDVRPMIETCPLEELPRIRTNDERQRAVPCCFNDRMFLEPPNREINHEPYISTPPTAPKSFFAEPAQNRPDDSLAAPLSRIVPHVSRAHPSPVRPQRSLPGGSLWK